jgi:biopolymer transport protein ExbD
LYSIVFIRVLVAKKNIALPASDQRQKNPGVMKTGVTVTVMKKKKIFWRCRP